MDPVGPVGPVILAVRAAPVAPIDQATPADRVTMAGLDGRATTADPATAGQAAPEDLEGLDGPATTADQMTAVGTGARRPPICPGVGWTRAVSTTSRSTTTAGG